jgi:hypothetical protein
MTTAPVASREEESIDHILASRHFVKAPLLSSFLSYVCRRALHDGVTRISEQEIGINVFHREGYDPAEDNIVRNYARQLRKRLEEYYADEGRHESLRIEIPKGGYLPLFVAQELEPSSSEKLPALQLIEPRQLDMQAGQKIGYWKILCVLSCALSLALAGVVVFLLHYSRKPEVSSSLHPLSRELFSPVTDTIIVPADTTLTLLEEMNNRRLSLEEYTRWIASQPEEPTIDYFLHRRKDTSVMSMRIASNLQMLPEVIPGRLFIRSSRNITLDDLKSSNAIFIGSIDSIPWIEAFQNHLNFRFVYDIAAKQGAIENIHPLADESAVYSGKLDRFSQETYAVLAFIPNLEKTGHLLLIQGLDASGTEAAADLLFQPHGMDEVMRRATRSDGSVRNFEVLLKTTVLESHPTNIHIVAIRTAP